MPVPSQAGREIGTVSPRSPDPAADATAVAALPVATGAPEAPMVKKMSVSDRAHWPGSDPAGNRQIQSPCLVSVPPVAVKLRHWAIIAAQVGKAAGRDTVNVRSPSTHPPASDGPAAEVVGAAVVTAGPPTGVGSEAQRVTAMSAINPPPGLLSRVQFCRSVLA